MERMKKNGSILAAVCFGVIGCVCIGLALKYGSETQEATPDAPKEQHENDTLEKAKNLSLNPNSTQDDCVTVANVENDQGPGRNTENEVLVSNEHNNNDTARQANHTELRSDVSQVFDDYGDNHAEISATENGVVVANGQNGHDLARKANDIGLRSDVTQDLVTAGVTVPSSQMDNTEVNNEVGPSNLAYVNTLSDDVVRKEQANSNESNLSNDASQCQSSDNKFRQSLKVDGVENNSLKPVSKRTKPTKRIIGASMNTYHKFDFQGLSNTCFMNIFLRLAILYPNESIEPFIDDATLKYLKIVYEFKKRVENDKSGTVIAGDVYKKALSARYDDIQNAMNNQNDPKEFSEYFFGEYACALSHTECVDVLPYVKIIYQDYYTLQYIPFLIYNFTSEIRNFDDLVKTGMRNYLELTSPNYYNEPEKRIFLQSGQLMTIQLNRSGQVIDEYIKIPDLCQYRLANEDEDKNLTRNDRITDFLVKEMPVVTNSADASTNPDSSVKAKKNTNFTVDSGRLSSCLLDEFNKKEFNYDRYTFKLKAAVVYYPSSDVRFGVNHYEIYIVRDGVIYREDATCCTKMDDEVRTLRLIGENGTFYTYEITDRTD